MAQSPPPRYSFAELIEELREAAEEIAPELHGIRAEETLEGESAQMIEEMADALKRIASGAPRPQDLARAKTYRLPETPSVQVSATALRIINPWTTAP